MVAGCLRRVGQLEAALQRYRRVHAAAPACTEALRYLAALSQDVGAEEDAQRYARELARLERLAAAAAAAPAAAPAALEGRVTAARPPTSGPRAGALPSLPPATAAPPAPQQRRGSGLPPPAGMQLPPTAAVL